MQLDVGHAFYAEGSLEELAWQYAGGDSLQNSVITNS